MHPSVSIITLAVSDLRTSIDFYTRLGLERTDEGDPASIAFFRINAGSMRLALYPAPAFSQDVGTSIEQKTGLSRMSLAHNVSSEATVDRILIEAEQIGATIVKPAEHVFWGGYSGYFADPDGYLWEVAYAPGSFDGFELGE